MHEIEPSFLDKKEFKSLVWFQYIEDFFFIWTHSKETLEEFLKNFNNYHPKIEIIHNFNKESITFRDIKPRWSRCQLTTDLQFISTDKHEYLHYASAPADHAKRSIVFSQALGVNRICANNTERDVDNMKSWFQARGYPKHLAQREIRKLRVNIENNSTKQSKSK